MNEANRWATFRFYRDDGIPPFPRTFATALHAYRAGLLPLEPTVYRAGSTESIFSQPLNVHLVLDLMANANTDHSVNQAIAAVLFENLGAEDPQVSDFAAQSLARLEGRYYQRIQEAEAHLASADGSRLEEAGNLAELYFEFAQLQQFNPMLRTFYLQKVLDMEGEQIYTEADGCEDTRLPVYRVRAFLGTGRVEEAREELARSKLDETPEGLWLAAEIAFVIQDLEEVQVLSEAALEAHEVFGVPADHTYRRVAEKWIRRG